MNVEKWISAAALAMILTATTACDDWGRQDPIAGNQVNPTLENVAAYDFEAEEGLDLSLFRLHANPGGSEPQVADDDIKGKVLMLDGGYVSLGNPFSKVVLQNAASFTFWMKQPLFAATAEDGSETTLPLDASSTLLAFVNDSGNGSLSINANGGINYNAADGMWTENDPETVKTGYLTPGEWHFVAVVLADNGYEWWVDGERKVAKEVVGFDCSKLVKFANNVSTFKIGDENNTTPWMIDDLKVYRNRLTAKETTRPNLGGGSAGGVDLSTFEYLVGEPVFNIGSPDCTAPWWTEFSNYYRIPSNTTMNFRFVNHTSGGGNWNNWNLCLCTDADRGADGYAEYIVIRSDLYGWGESYDGGNWTSEGYGDWDKFRVDMEGAIVNVKVVREDTKATITAIATCPDGTVYKESIFAECGNANDVVRAFFIVDGSYLEFDKNGCFASWSVPVTSAAIGAEDCSAPWWTEFSDYFSIPKGLGLHLGFQNFTSGGGNWNNWNLCVCTDAERGADGYAEYFVIRSDLYGWGESYDGGNWSNEGYGDWDKFRVDMNGAYVDLSILRDNETANVEAKASCSDGTVYIERFHGATGNANDQIRAFLIVDGSHLKMNTSDCYLYIPVYK